MFEVSGRRRTRIAIGARFVVVVQARRHEVGR